MNQSKITPINELKLKRALYGHKEPTNLFPYDAADEYLIEMLQSEAYRDICSPVIIFNDAFGALSIALSEFEPFHVSDSFVSQLSLKQNVNLNHIKSDLISLKNSTEALPLNPGLIVIKIPKSLSLLEHQLKQIKSIMCDKTKIIAAAKAQDIHSSTLKLFEKIGDTKTSLAKKKARLVFCTPLLSKSQEVQAPSLSTRGQIVPEMTSWSLNNEIKIVNYPNVFSRNQLDIGARFLLEHLPVGKTGTIVDLGCGNGVIGLHLLKLNPAAKVIFTDESYMAIASSRLNVENNCHESLKRSEFLISDALHNFPKGSVDIILCNPPFHQQNTLTCHIATSMFINAHKSLVPGGELIVIGNRHLDYFHRLKTIFGNCTNIASNKKFFILKAQKK